MRLLQQELQTRLLQEAPEQTKASMKGPGIGKTRLHVLLKCKPVQHNAYSLLNPGTVDCHKQEALPNSSRNTLEPDQANLSSHWQQQQQPAPATHPPNMSQPVNAPWWQHSQDDRANGPSQIVQQLQLSQQNPVQYNCMNAPAAALNQQGLPSRMLLNGPSNTLQRDLNLDHSSSHPQPWQHIRHDDAMTNHASTSLPFHQQTPTCQGGYQPIGVNSMAAGACMMPDWQRRTPAATLHGSNSPNGSKAFGLEATTALPQVPKQVRPSTTFLLQNA